MTNNTIENNEVMTETEINFDQASELDNVTTYDIPESPAPLVTKGDLVKAGAATLTGIVVTAVAQPVVEALSKKIGEGCKKLGDKLKAKREERKAKKEEKKKED